MARSRGRLYIYGARVHRSQGGPMLLSCTLRQRSQAQLRRDPRVAERGGAARGRAGVVDAAGAASLRGCSM